MHAESSFTQVFGQLGRPVVQEHGLAHDHRVAAKRDGLLDRDLDQVRNPIAQHRAAIFVERAGIVQGKVRRQRAEAGIEVIETRVDQLERQDLDAQPLADPLVAAHIAAKPVAGDQRLAAKEGVAGPFEVVARRELDDLEPAAPGPAFKVRRFALPHAVSEPRADEEIAKDQAGIGREDQVGKARAPARSGRRTHPGSRASARARSTAGGRARRRCRPARSSRD